MENRRNPESSAGVLLEAGGSESSARAAALVVIRIFVLWSLLSSILFLLASIPPLLTDFGAQLWALSLYLVQPLFWLAVFVKADAIADRFIDDSRIALSIDLETALRLGVILLGLHFFIDGVTQLASLLAMRSVVLEPMARYPIYDDGNRGQLIHAGLTTIAGALLIALNHRIATFTATRSDNSDPQPS